MAGLTPPSPSRASRWRRHVGDPATSSFGARCGKFLHPKKRRRAKIYNYNVKLNLIQAGAKTNSQEIRHVKIKMII
jgi:hypothetical protein